MYLRRIKKNLLNQIAVSNPLLNIFIDLFIFLKALFIVIYFSSEKFFIDQLIDQRWIFLILSLICILVYIISGKIYWTRSHNNTKVLYQLSKINFIVVLPLYFICLTSYKSSLNHIHFLLLWFLATSMMTIFRKIFKDLYQSEKFPREKKLKVVIYGAGWGGSQLYKALIETGGYEILFFVDDNPKLWGKRLNFLHILSPSKIKNLKNKIDLILLAIPSISKDQFQKTISFLNLLNLKYLKVPSIDDITTGKLKINSLQPISIEDLMSREKEVNNISIIEESFLNKTICITGAGGSIGTQLCKELIVLKPRELILIDNSEINLYKLQKLMKDNCNNLDKPLIEYHLLDVSKESRFRNFLKKKRVNLILHAAAYKHVPIVEKNPIEGIENNIFSTYEICKGAVECKVDMVVLISSDKAVRPTNIMGATKRVGELIVQDFGSRSKKQIEFKQNTKFAIVRFGNVLRSSGSVVPLFEKQILEKGPITLTDKKVERFFMTIKEAAQLVLQTTGLGEFGEIFLLDMGKSIKIFDLAKTMVKINQLTIKDENNPEGDIEIKEIGLRPGEKLYEELLINDSHEKTTHPLIYKANEEYPAGLELKKLLKELSIQTNKNNKEESLKILKKLVPEWITLEVKDEF